MGFRYKYRVSAWKYLDKYYIKFYHRNASYGYNAYYVKESQMKIIHDWYLKGENHPMEFIDSDNDKVLMSLDGLFLIGIEHMKDRFSEQYRDKQEALKQIIKLEEEGIWVDIKLKED